MGYHDRECEEICDALLKMAREVNVEADPHFVYKIAESACQAMGRYVFALEYRNDEIAALQKSLNALRADRASLLAENEALYASLAQAREQREIR